MVWQDETIPHNTLPALYSFLMTASTSSRIGDSRLAGRLRQELQGDVLFDSYSRGRYSTDASIYQIEPVGVVVPKTEQDIQRAIHVAVDEGVPILPRGGGTSQCGQTVGEALVIDTSKFLNQIIDFNAEERRITVQPGIVLDQLNKFLKPHGLFFPVDVSTSSRATIGGMAANNSCGARSIRYGNMVHNVSAIETILASGSECRFGDVPANLDGIDDTTYLDIIQRMRMLGDREAQEIAERFPKLLRRVGGYNIDTISPQGHNMAHLLVGSEGTLGFFKQIELSLQPIPPHKVLGVCHFPTFYQAMATTQHIVELGPSAVELVDRTMIDLARDIEAFRATTDRFVMGEPQALLLVEFTGDDAEEQHRKLKSLVELMADHGFADVVLEVTDPAFQSEIWEVRKAGLNIMMSMKGDGKPVSFIEDCAVELEDLAEYTDRLTNVFKKHGTNGTWYAHASVGTLHVRPVLNMKDGTDVKKMREIAEEAFAMVREYKGSHSGEHGDGLVRSEFHEPMFGSRIARAFEEVKDTFDPNGSFNPGKIVRPSKMDDRTLFRYKPGYKTNVPDMALDWSEWGGFAGAVEMCNNNGACRKADAGVMCPSYRVSGEEIHLTRGRANTLRLAISGQLGKEAFTADELYGTLDFCVGCKGCKRECPTGVDMSRMKIEFLHHYRRQHGVPLKEKLIAHLPRYAPFASRFRYLMNLRDTVPGLAWLSEKLLGFSRKRSLPQWHAHPFKPNETAAMKSGQSEVILLADTFNMYFEPENLRAAVRVLEAANYHVHVPVIENTGKPLCCGRTYLATGLLDQAKQTARETLKALKPYLERGIPIIGLEPSCLLTLRDEYMVLEPGADTISLAGKAKLFEEFLAEEHAAGRLFMNLKPLRSNRALLHGHCHQKAFGAMGAVETILNLIPELNVETVESSCCGMAGAFGYEAEHYDMSMKMAELSLLPKVRDADMDALIVADGTSCRHQIHDGAAREAIHVARVLEMALAP
ncbi:MAG: FAD-linked oxidase C-terminal domain-containing protein [Rhodospirillaceae bacterium]